jgi:hypothetical protein
MQRVLRSAAYLVLLLLLTVGAPRAWSQEIVHGADSVFVAPTVKVVWVVQKGPNEETSFVLLRIVNSAGRYRRVRLDGVDPFSKNRKVLVSARPLPTSIDLTVPRSSFAEYPSCEIQLYHDDESHQSPSLTVYYLGVPDTTPEFATAHDAQAYLAKMVGK